MRGTEKLLQAVEWSWWGYPVCLATGADCSLQAVRRGGYVILLAVPPRKRELVKFDSWAAGPLPAGGSRLPRSCSIYFLFLMGSWTPWVLSCGSALPRRIVTRRAACVSSLLGGTNSPVGEQRGFGILCSPVTLEMVFPLCLSFGSRGRAGVPPTSGPSVHSTLLVGSLQDWAVFTGIPRGAMSP